MSQFQTTLQSGLILSTINFFQINLLLYLYDPLNPLFQFGLGDIIGVDGISLWLIWLTNLTMIIVRMGKQLDKRLQLILNIINFLQINCFIFLDILLFYINFEIILIPMFYLIGYYGSRNKKFIAINQLLIYTIFGSLPLLISILFIKMEFGTTNQIIQKSLDVNLNQYLFQGFLLAFLIKIPIFPFHIWLPLAHTEGSTNASIILAAILLKLGSYGILRFCLTQFNIEIISDWLPLIFLLSLISIIYSCISAISLIDIKQIIAYSSIAHMNIGLIGQFSLNNYAILGSYLYGISHGIISTALFLIIGLLYDRFNTRTIKYFRGLIMIFPLLITFYFIFTLGNISFPLTSGFLSEILIYYGHLQFNPFSSLLLILFGCLLLPLYFVWSYQKIAKGFLSNHILINFQDINKMEFHLLITLTFFMFYLGINPHIIINDILLPVTLMVGS